MSLEPRGVSENTRNPCGIRLALVLLVIFQTEESRPNDCPSPINSRRTPGGREPYGRHPSPGGNLLRPLVLLLDCGAPAYGGQAPSWSPGVDEEALGRRQSQLYGSAR